jgi:hypothetical protein
VHLVGLGKQKKFNELIGRTHKLLASSIVPQSCAPLIAVHSDILQHYTVLTLTALKSNLLEEKCIMFRNIMMCHFVSNFSHSA